MNWLCRIRRLDDFLDAKIQAFRGRWFDAKKAKLVAIDGEIDPSAGRTRMDAFTGSIHSFPYMLWHGAPSDLAREGVSIRSHLYFPRDAVGSGEGF